MSKPSPTRRKGVVIVEPLNWVSPEMRKKQNSKDHDAANANEASSSDKEE